MTKPGGPGAPTPAVTTVFFSYSRADQKRARPVIRVLEDAGFAVWWDGLLGGGERFAHATADALDRAQAVVVLWSSTSVDSHWVHDEATAGRDRGRLVPLSLDGSAPPLGFRQFQTIDLSHGGLRAGSPEMVQLVEAVAALHAEALPLRKTPRARRGIGRRAMLASAGGLVALGGAAAVWRLGLLEGSGAAANSIAVLPFDNMSRDPAQNYFADGLSAEVRAALARNAALRVVGQTSSDVFKPRAEDAKVIARKLGVLYLLDGNVRLAGVRVRVSAELIDGRSGFSRWSQTFDRSLDDIFAVQSEIAAAVTAALTREVSSAPGVKVAGGTEDVASFDAYLRGRAAFALASGLETDREALARFDEAVDRDPKFAAAHAARSRTLTAIANIQPQGAERRTLYDAAIAAARRAVTLAPELADAQSSLGYALVKGRLDIRGARAPYERSYQLGRGDPEVLGRFALYSANIGRFPQAEAAVAQATGLDPLNARTFWNTGYVLFAARRYAEAIAAMRQALALNPSMASVNGYIGYALVLLGKIDEAERAILLERSGLNRLPGIAIVARRRGQDDRAREALGRLVTEYGDNGLYQQAEVLAQWGDAPGAIQALQKARLAGDSGLTLAGQDPLLDPIRKAPELSRLLHELGFD